MLALHGALVSFALRWSPEEGAGYRCAGVERIDVCYPANTEPPVTRRVRPIAMR